MKEIFFQKGFSKEACLRLEDLRQKKAGIDKGEIADITPGRDVNNHIHSTFSFSPYTPTAALWRAWQAGLCTAGIVDHDTVSGVKEFIKAGEIMGFPVTVGAEVRVNHAKTPLGKRRTNNPDQRGISYLALHGIPKASIDNADDFFKPIRAARGKRNRIMCKKISELTGIPLSYEKDVLPISMAHEGGSVTERHILYALSVGVINKYGKGESLIKWIEKLMPLTSREISILENIEDKWYGYRLLGIFKAGLVEKFYTPANNEECPDMDDVISFAYKNGIILTYPYLGDVEQSVTGDKKAQLFEDSFLDELFVQLREMDIKAVSYMPSRNTMAQIKRVRALCERHNMLQITGEDINSPFQSFICKAQRDPAFSILYDTTWALIGHEIASDKSLKDGFLGVDMPLDEKIRHFKDIARANYF